MYKAVKSIDDVNVRLEESVDSKLKEVSNWAPQLTEKQESYPSYWSLKGWKCFIQC